MPNVTVIVDKKEDYLRLLERLGEATPLVRVVMGSYHVSLPEGLSAEDYASIMEGIPYRIEGAA